MHRIPTTQHQLADWLMRQTPVSGTRRVMPLGAALGSETGIVREENQDRVAIARGRDGAGRPFAIAAIADGIGGMKAGAGCASDAMAAMFASIFRNSQRNYIPEAWLENAFLDANNFVYSKYKRSGGTTLVVLLLIEGCGGFWASIGDSRLYLASDYELTQLSKDDTIAGQLGKRPELTIEQSKLLQFIGIGDPLELKVEPVKAGVNALAYLTTDGVHFLERSGGVFEAVIHHAPDPGACVRRLTELSRWAGGPDNASALVVPVFPDFDISSVPSHCLDVWDPFGEIRIAEVSAEKIQQSFNPSPHVLRIPSAEFGEATNTEEHTDTEAHADGAGDVDTTNENLLNANKPQRKRKPRKKSALGGKAPQVKLEFLGKDE